MSSRLELGPGDRYGQFEIVEQLGQGAFAAVYRVRTPSRASAALKLSLRPVGDSDESRRAKASGPCRHDVQLDGGSRPFSL